MDDAQKCADRAIDRFVKSLGAPYYPVWANLVPGDPVNGWDASTGDWGRQASKIMDDFEACVGVKIGRDYAEIEKLRHATLATLDNYLVEKAQYSAAKLSLKMAKLHLQTIKSAITTFEAR